MLETQNQNESRFNRHHLFFKNDSYKGRYERQKFRDHEGLVIPVLRSAHTYLHDNIFPPPKPTREMMEGMVESLDQDLTTVLEIDPFYALSAVINYLEEYKGAAKDAELAGHAQMIQMNLGFQALILSNKFLVEVLNNEQAERLIPSLVVTHGLLPQTGGVEYQEPIDTRTPRRELVQRN